MMKSIWNHGEFHNASLSRGNCSSCPEGAVLDGSTCKVSCRGPDEEHGLDLVGGDWNQQQIGIFHGIS